MVAGVRRDGAVGLSLRPLEEDKKLVVFFFYGRDFDEKLLIVC